MQADSAEITEVQIGKMIAGCTQWPLSEDTRQSWMKEYQLHLPTIVYPRHLADCIIARFGIIKKNGTLSCELEKGESITVGGDSIIEYSN
jgi:hypothetical protein